MPNRIIKESIRTSKAVNSMTDFQFRLWLYLITYVDDYGRGSADPEILKGFVFPRRKRLSESDISKALAELAGMGCINLYNVDGESYFYFPNWGNHQRIQTKRPKFPDPIDNKFDQHKSTVSHGESPPESNPIQSELKSESESESESNITPSGGSEPVKKATLAEDFERLWKLYPKKQGKDRAFNDFKKALKDGFTVEEIEKGINDYCFYIKQKGVEQQYIKHGSTWFHGKHWLDDYTVANDNRPKKGALNNFQGRNIDYAEIEQQEQAYIKNMLDKKAGKAGE